MSVLWDVRLKRFDCIFDVIWPCIFIGDGVMVYEIRHQIDEAIERLQEISRGYRKREPYDSPMMERFTPSGEKDAFNRLNVSAKFVATDKKEKKSIDMPSLRYVR